MSPSGLFVNIHDDWETARGFGKVYNVLDELFSPGPIRFLKLETLKRVLVF